MHFLIFVTHEAELVPGVRRISRLCQKVLGSRWPIFHGRFEYLPRTLCLPRLDDENRVVTPPLLDLPDTLDTPEPSVTVELVGTMEIFELAVAVIMRRQHTAVPPYS